MADILQNGVTHEEEDDEFHDAEDGFANGEQATAIAAKNDAADIDGAETKEDDRTEDQVPDISGTDNVADQMTNSVDEEIEEIPLAAADGGEEGADGAEVVEEDGEVQQTEVPDQLENAEVAEGEVANEGVVEIPVSVVEAEAEAPAVSGEEGAEAPEGEATEAVEEAAEPAAEYEADPEVAAEEPIEAEAEAAEESTPEAEAEEPADAAEEQQPAVETAEEDGFQLQDPPTPKRPKTPIELDAPAVEVAEISEDEAPPPQTPKTPKSPAKEAIGSVPATPKSPAGSLRRESNANAAPKSPLANGTVLPGTPVPPTPRSAAAVGQSPRTPAAAAGGETPKAKTEFVFEEASPVPTPKSPKKTTFDEDILSTTSSAKSKSRSPSKSPPKSPRAGRKVRRTRAAKSLEADGDEAAGDDAAGDEPKADESEEAAAAEPAADEAVEPQEAAPEADTEAEVLTAKAELEAAVPEAEDKPVEPAVEKDEPAARADEDEAPVPTRSRARIQSLSPPPRASARGADRKPAPRDYTPYDQDSHRETVPPRLPTSTSFTSWAPPERQSYKAISPWVDTSGPFSHNLYATSRLLERSRSRTRERRSALRSQRSASNYYRFASQFPPPLRTRDYSTPPTAAISKTPSRDGSFISFMEFSAAKNYDVTRSRGSLYDSNQALSRASSRGNIDYYLGSGRISRVDSYVNNLNSRYEWYVPSNYETYRSASRSRVSGYTPVNEYTSYANPLYDDAQRVRDTGLVRSMYEGRIDDLQRNLSKERYERDRLRSRYAMVASQLEQACKQMDLLRTNSYSLQRSGSTPRTSVYGNYYPSPPTFGRPTESVLGGAFRGRTAASAELAPPVGGRGATARRPSALSYRTADRSRSPTNSRAAYTVDLRAAGRSASFSRPTIVVPPVNGPDYRKQIYSVGSGINSDKYNSNSDKNAKNKYRNDGKKYRNHNNITRQSADFDVLSSVYATVIQPSTGAALRQALDAKVDNLLKKFNENKSASPFSLYSIVSLPATVSSAANTVAVARYLERRRLEARVLRDDSGTPPGRPVRHRKTHFTDGS